MFVLKLLFCYSNTSVTDTVYRSRFGFTRSKSYTSIFKMVFFLLALVFILNDVYLGLVQPT